MNRQIETCALSVADGLAGPVHEAVNTYLELQPCQHLLGAADAVQQLMWLCSMAATGLSALQRPGMASYNVTYMSLFLSLYLHHFELSKGCKRLSVMSGILSSHAHGQLLDRKSRLVNALKDA